MGVHFIKEKISHNAILAAAKTYMNRGWYVVPVQPKSKVCSIANWQKFDAGSDLETYFPPAANIGVLLETSNLSDVDIDSADAKPFLNWLPPTKAKWGRSGNQQSHYLYTGVRKTRKFANSKGVVIEIRSAGSYAVMPPSVHPEGEAYQWESEGDPAVAAELECAVTKIAVAATLLPAWQPDVRHDLALATAGLLSKAGWSADQVRDLITTVAKTAGDHEVADREEAVNTTYKALQEGKPVAGLSKLVEFLGEKDAHSISKWVALNESGLTELASRARNVKEKRRVAALVREDLMTRGDFYRTRDTHELLYFYREERQLYRLDSIDFRALCADLYDINAREPVWGFVEEHLQSYCLRHGEERNIYQFSRYQDGKLYVYAGEQQVFRLDGTNVETINNGDDGILFKDEHTLTPIKPDFKFKGSPVRAHLVNVANAINPACLDLLHIYIHSLFFESLQPTKPVVLLTGPKGSGKTSAGRALKRALYGGSVNVDTGMASKEDAFWAGVCNNYLVCIDNVDTLVPWLADSIAVVSTGSTLKRRKLYETNTLVEYVPHCFLMITSRNPQSFTRDDVVDRLLLIEVERRQTFVEESYLLQELDSKRSSIWGELLTNLNKMVKALQQPLPKHPLVHRLADWARLAIRFAPLLGIKDVQKTLSMMDASKVDFALEDNPVAQGLEEWIAVNPEPQFIATGELFHQIVQLYETKSMAYPIKNARSFGMQLRNLRPELGTRYKIEEKTGSGNKKLLRLKPLHPTGEQLLNSQTDDLAKLL